MLASRSCYSADAGAEEAIAQDPDDQDHRDDNRHRGAAFGVHGLAEDEKENEREQIVEENYRPVAQSQLQIERNECLVGFHSRPSLAEGLSGELDEDVFQAGLLEADVG